MVRHRPETAQSNEVEAGGRGRIHPASRTVRMRRWAAGLGGCM